MHAPQPPGIARSLPKLAKPTASIASTGFCSLVASSSIAAAPLKPIIAIVRRVFAVPSRFAIRPETIPQKNEPSPPKKSGMQFSIAASHFPSCGNDSFMNVGIHVM